MGGNSPCAACKLLRRRCAEDCIFAPYFPSDDPHKYAIVHKVFGASNVSKMLQVLSLMWKLSITYFLYISSPSFCPTQTSYSISILTYKINKGSTIEIAVIYIQKTF